MLARTQSRGADALVRTLKQAGVTRIFTLSGNHVMSVFDALVDSGIELIHTRHEGAAVHMADAFARLTGAPGVALVTGGPGHGNAVSALYTAQMSESPVILLSGHAPHGELGMGSFQEVRQADMAAPMAKAAWTARSAEGLAEDVARAVRTALGGRPGAVNLNLPSDVLHASVKSESTPGFRPEPARLAPDRAEAIMALLAQASRPLVLAGPSLLTRDGRARLAQLEERSGVPVIGMESPRGMLDPSLGAFAEVVARADRVLLLGKRLDFTLKFGKVFAADCAFAQLDAEPAEFERTRRAVGDRLKLAELADAFPAVEALMGRRGTRSGWADEVRAAVSYRPAAWQSAQASKPGRLHPAQLARPLQSILDSDPDSVLVMDGGEIGQWAQACLSAPRRVINGVGGSIGGGLPFALGARVAEPGAPVVAVMGDGTFGFHVAELDTAVTYNLPFVAAIGNDARWNAEYQIQLREYGAARARGCEMREQRYDTVARAFGAWAEQVSEPGEMPAAARRALASRQPACLDVLIEGIAAPQVRR